MGNAESNSCPSNENLMISAININPLNLVDINDDCLEAIFKYLNLVSLVNVAESDERFIAVARLVYFHRYRSKLVYLNLNEKKDEHDDDDDILKIENGMIELFLRHFGHLVQNFTLNHVKLNSLQINNFQTLTKPLEMVEKLSINKSYLGPKLSKLNIWFPNLATLQLSHVKLMQPEALEVHFSQLKHLVIFNEGQTIQQTTIGELLRFNPQLETLTLRCNLDVDFLQIITKFTPQLENLALWAPTDRFESFGDQKISFESVKEFKLKSWFDCGEEFLVEVPFKFDKLQKLMLYGFNEFKGEILKFIKQNQDLTQLQVLLYSAWDFLEIDQIVEMIDTLPKLIELEFSAHFMNQNELIQLLEKLKHLKTVRLWFAKRTKCDIFQRIAEENWIIATRSIDMEQQKQYFCMELERKI